MILVISNQYSKNITPNNKIKVRAYFKIIITVKLINRKVK